MAQNKPTVHTSEERSIARDEMRARLELISQETRANIIQNVLGHPWMMPSLHELDYYNPGKTKGTIKGHVDKLLEGGMLARVTIPQGRRRRNCPDTFYVLPGEAYAFLERHAIFVPDLDEIRHDHARVDPSEDDAFPRHQVSARPTIDVPYDHPLRGDGDIVDPTEYAPDVEHPIEDIPDNCGPVEEPPGEYDLGQKRVAQH